MGLLQPLALLALPLALLPLLLSWRGRRRGAPRRFSSLHLFDEARRRPAPPRARRSRKALLLRILAIALLVLAAARPVGPGPGGPGAHRPTAVLVAVDVSASLGQREAGGTAWSSVEAWADSILGLTSRDDRVALAAVADGIVGWWTGPSEVLRRRLAALGPTARASDWPETLRSLDARLEDGSYAYLLTDGAVGARPPEPRPADRDAPAGRRALRIWEAPAGVNRSLAEVRWATADRVALGGRGWGTDAPAVAGRLRGRALADSAAIPLGGGIGAATWAVADSATFALAETDRLAADDRLYVARGPGSAYRIARLAAPGEPPESGPLFWEVALASSTRGPDVARVRRLAELTASPPALALLPIRAYRPDEAAALAALAARGTRLLFAPACPEPACVPSGGWLSAPGAELPGLRWRLDDPDRRTALAGGPGRPGVAGVPEHLLERVPIRGALEAQAGPHPEWTWDLASGEPALWVRGPVALWLVPLGPPVTRLATTPLFPLVAEAVLQAWDPAWSGSGSIRVGDPAPLPPGGATVTGPLHDPQPTSWAVAGGDVPPRLERPGLYRLDDGRTTFVAVNGDPAEGNLEPVSADLWEAAWGARPTSAGEWQDELFAGRRRGPELWPWVVVLALAGLIAEARLRRAGNRQQQLQ